MIILQLWVVGGGGGGSNCCIRGSLLHDEDRWGVANGMQSERIFTERLHPTLGLQKCTSDGTSLESAGHSPS